MKPYQNCRAKEGNSLSNKTLQSENIMKEVLQISLECFLGQMKNCSLQFKNMVYHCLFPPRHVLQLHHDDGGEQCGVDCGGAQLSPQDRRDPRYAYVGG